MRSCAKRTCRLPAATTSFDPSAEDARLSTFVQGALLEVKTQKEPELLLNVQIVPWLVAAANLRPSAESAMDCQNVLTESCVQVAPEFEDTRIWPPPAASLAAAARRVPSADEAREVQFVGGRLA